MEDVHHRQPDGTMIYGLRRVKGKPTTGVLVIPSLGETVLGSHYEKLASHLLEKNTAVIVMELRGHKLSEGEWSLHAFRADVTYWLAEFRRLFKNFYVIASGFSATTLLEYDDQAHTFQNKFPPLPDGMVLINPIFEGHELLPKHGSMHKVARSMFGQRAVENKLKHFGVRFHDPIVFWREMENYSLQPVRIQTPSVVFVAQDELSDPLQRIFGTATIQRAKWLHIGSRVELAKHLADVKKALKDVMSGEKPIRFKASY